MKQPKQFVVKREHSIVISTDDKGVCVGNKSSMTGSKNQTYIGLKGNYGLKDCAKLLEHIWIIEYGPIATELNLLGITLMNTSLEFKIH